MTETDNTAATDERELEDEIWDALNEVSDPDLPMSIVELGLIYDVDVTDGCVSIEMTFTSMGCPATEMLKVDARTRVTEIDGIRDVEIETVWDPPWTKERITETGRQKLRTAGISI